MLSAPLLLARFIMTFLFASIGLTIIDGNPVGWVLTVSVVVVTANYLVGDLLTLPRYGNMATSLAEGILAALGAYVLSLIFMSITVSLTGLTVFGGLVAAGEYLLHKYLRRPEDLAP